MAYGTYTFNKIQLGRETTPGTAVAATTIWRGPFVMVDDTRDRQVVEETVGLFVPAERSFDAWLGAQLTMAETELTFEQVLHLLEAGIMAATPSGTGPYTYTYTLGSGAPSDIKTYTLQAGNTLVSGDNLRMPHSYVEQFTLRGKAKESWKMGGAWMGAQAEVSALTGSLSLPSVEEALFGNTKLYLDASGGTIGSTQATGVLMGAEIQVNTGIMPVPVGDGNIYYQSLKRNRPEITYSLILELEDSSVVVTERTAQRAGNIRLLRLLVEGTSSRSLTIDLAAKHDRVNPYEDQDGNTVVKIDGHAVYSSTDSLFAVFKVINNLSSVP